MSDLQITYPVKRPSYNGILSIMYEWREDPLYIPTSFYKRMAIL